MFDQILTLADDHPLIRAGFRGLLKLPDGTEVEILSRADGRGGSHLIPRRDRRALQYVADGCGPDELAELFELPSDRAERLYDRILNRYGLSAIALQVRAASSLDPRGPIPYPIGRRLESFMH